MAISRDSRMACLALAGVAVGVVGAPGVAQQPNRLSIGPPASGVLQPPSQVDPKMTHRTPRLPAQSMPVIHPRGQDRGGTVTVPR